MESRHYFGDEFYSKIKEFAEKNSEEISKLNEYPSSCIGKKEILVYNILEPESVAVLNSLPLEGISSYKFSTLIAQSEALNELEKILKLKKGNFLE